MGKKNCEVLALHGQKDDMSAQLPTDNHPAYARLNEALRARFAAAALRAAIDAELDALPRLLAALRAGRMAALMLNLDTGKCGPEMARSVVRNLPPALTALELAVHSSVGAVMAEELAAALPQLASLKEACLLASCAA